MTLQYTLLLAHTLTVRPSKMTYSALKMGKVVGYDFIAGRPKAALLFWFFGDFRCGALLFMVILVIYKYKNR